MNFKDEKSRILFLKYALPCADTLVKRGFVEKRTVTDAIEDVTLGRKVGGHPERIFKTALKECGKIAGRLGNSLVTEGAVRQYFLFEHDDVIDIRYKIFHDFDPDRCRTYSGKIVGNNVVKTITGSKRYRTFVPSLKRGDFVVVHRSFIVESISRALAGRMRKSKQKYFNSRVP
jgi:hypothetical protein